ncbi:MAG: T9SS type A sorting domain-containing protein [Cyclobacteriaceae bacterium]
MKLISKVSIGVLLSWLFVAPTYGQEEKSGDLLSHLDNTINALPGSSGNLYAYPDVTQSQTWKEVIGLIMDEDYAGAVTKASQLDYALIKFTDNTEAETKIYYILERASTGNYWGTYVFNPTACRSQLVIQSPHPVFDSNTGKQGAYVFKKADAAAFFVSGTHRCNTTTPTSCSGSTSVCGSSQAYRISDVAHNVLGPFHLATDVLNTRFSFGVFIQLHGFAKQAGDPSAIMSNGTRTTPSPDYIGRLKNELVKVDATLTFKVGHLDFEWDRLLATTNTQGRLINLSVDPCSTNATNTKGQFIHIEQEFDKLRASKQKWDVMVTGIQEVFKCGVVTGDLEKEQNQGFSFYPNPFNDKLNILKNESTASMVLEIYSAQGQRLIQMELIRNITIALPALREGTYIYRVKKANQVVEQGRLIKLADN